MKIVIRNVKGTNLNKLTYNVFGFCDRFAKRWIEQGANCLAIGGGVRVQIITKVDMENESSKQEKKQALRKTDVSGSLPCGCLKCYPNVFPNLRFNVCPICGNKRCPHASDHNYECTNSNDVGQTGSVYGGNDR